MDFAIARVEPTGFDPARKGTQIHLQTLFRLRKVHQPVRSPGAACGNRMRRPQRVEVNTLIGRWNLRQAGQQVRSRDAGQVWARKHEIFEMNHLPGAGRVNGLIPRRRWECGRWIFG